MDYRSLLSNKKKELMKLPPEKILDRILDDPYPAAIVHSFSEEDFYFLIHEIGPEDSLELLSLASNQQWDYLIDMEIWNKDRIQIQSVTQWLKLMLQADPNRLIQWLVRDQTQFFEYYLHHTIQVMIREHDQDPSELGDNLFTLDDVIYIRFLQQIPSDQTNQTDEEQEAFLMEVFHRLADFDFITYQNILFEFQTVIRAEYEEEIYRMRNVRLAEKGFVPFDEAIGIYQPIKPNAIQTLGKKYRSCLTDRDDRLPVPLFSEAIKNGGNLFAQAIKSLENVDIILDLQSEFAGLSNHIISADQKPIRDRTSLKAIVEKASGYISIGLEILTQHNSPSECQTPAEWIQTYPLINIFRVGYGAASELKWETQKWRKTSWFKQHNLPISFWGEEWMGVLGGLLIPKPLYFDNYQTGTLYREFQSLDDIRETRRSLYQIMAFDDLFTQMNQTLGSLSKQFLTYKSLLLTLWARHYLGLGNEPDRIHISTFLSFFADLLPESNNRRAIRDDMKSSFLNWLSKQSGLDDDIISKKLGHSLENLFMEIETEYGQVSAKHLDPKHVYLFLLQT